MLRSRCPLPRSHCASKYSACSTKIYLGFVSVPLPEPPLISRDSRSLFRHWHPPQTDRRISSRISSSMAPKQATLGYVKPSQQTLRCETLHSLMTSQLTSPKIVFRRQHKRIESCTATVKAEIWRQGCTGGEGCTRKGSRHLDRRSRREWSVCQRGE